MRNYIGDQEVVTAYEFEELAYGGEEYALNGFQELFLGNPDETDEQNNARVEVAREVLAELLNEGESDHIAWLDAMYAVQLVCMASLRRQLRTQRVDWVGRAA
ncbi:hypothetical protein ACIRRI_34185 [Streptomyces mirabilis]|uniref:hypothetical protein n=1 Tax=Streptomyces mirabilis TaxID=68239 RepID=UPI00380E154E